MTKKKVIEILKLGDFTIAYHDSDYCDIYMGKHNYEDLPGKPIMECGGSSIGYIPDVVELLVKALGGKVESV